MELLLRSQARTSLSQFTEAALGFIPAPHHRYINDRLEAVLRGDVRRLMLFAPPGSAKSSYVSVAFPAYALGCHPSLSILSAAHTTELAERWGRRVRNLITSEEYQRLFPIRLSSDNQAAGRWTTTDGGEYYSAGVGAAILGLRCDFGIIDDPIAGHEQAYSERDRARVWEWYKTDFWSRLKPEASVVLIMQRWHEDDLAGRILADAKTGGEQWEVVTLTMEALEGDVLGRVPGEMLWPEWYKPEMVKQAKRDPRAWLALYQQQPRAESGGEFKRPWIQYYTVKPTSGQNLYVLVDPANQKKNNSDYTVMLVIGLGQDNNYYVLEIVRDRLNLTERADRLFSLHRKYRPVGVGYEKYGMQADVEHMRDKMERENYRFTITELGGSLKKEDRIRRLIPLFETRRVWFPVSQHTTDSQGVLTDLVRDFIQEEYLAFPVGRHDDMLDALARITDETMNVTWPIQAAREAADDEPQSYGSQAWMR